VGGARGELLQKITLSDDEMQQQMQLYMNVSVQLEVLPMEP
jgi:hypothetical protein